MKVKEYEAHAEQAKVEQKRIDYEERRKTAAVCFVTLSVLVNMKLNTIEL